MRRWRAASGQVLGAPQPLRLDAGAELAEPDDPAEALDLQDRRLAHLSAVVHLARHPGETQLLSAAPFGRSQAWRQKVMHLRGCAAR